MDLAATTSHQAVTDEPFFAPAPFDLIDGLIGRYQAMRARIHAVAASVTGETAGAMSYFFQAADLRVGRGGIRGNVADVFREDFAVAALDASYWQQALDLTDIYAAMPQKRRDEWNAVISEHRAPTFDEESVRSTIGDLLMARGTFFAERVDGLFRALSHTHVTNAPTGFNRRMIISHVFNEWGSVEWSRCGSINDLRCVIAKFMGRDEPARNTTSHDLDACRRRIGQWHVLDGGALRVRVYKIGTAHLEIHPDMAWRLNAVLHTLYPTAIAANERVKPAKPQKSFATMQRPLPFAVLAALRNARTQDRVVVFGYGGDQDDKHVLAEARRVLVSIGGVVSSGGVQFDYEPGDVIGEILRTGCIPDQVSHQFYPTPETVAIEAIRMAKIDDGNRCLEPSAGDGALAGLMPADTLCVEISALRCTVLRAKGHTVEEADFLAWGRKARRFDRIVMNPPYSQKRWSAHLQAAADLLAPGGRLVAVLPASARGKTLIPGFVHSWSPIFDNAFAGTSIAVSVVALEYPG